MFKLYLYTKHYFPYYYPFSDTGDNGLKKRQVNVFVSCSHRFAIFMIIIKKVPM